MREMKEYILRIAVSRADVGERRCRISQALRRRGAVHADAYDAGKAAIGQSRALKQYSGELGVVPENIIRPFEFEARVVADRFAKRTAKGDASNKAELRRECCRQRVDQEKRRVEIAGRRNPGPRLPAPTLALRFGDKPGS